ncbi:maltooligosyl trehalose hydrolase [Cnuella takakiae]|uniref:Malto-oligosyltrehalose trehalohydrolase n=1 Tax=Cnuella takakiae TaxID=1302690 RepID=A0A1M5BZA5_9BACT|nr:malto-oligosyltrehalose trehalohydrolase [Cnuella takakiae]OLY93562.1 malto-oligosyltrehalose trehalohydrolase [Cnuella takakiae]SHF47677.1 maltooligosyl trehalose hydrolase [Cnuella takakiae]
MNKELRPGAWPDGKEQTQLVVWAPLANKLTLHPEGSTETTALQPAEQGYWTLTTNRLQAGSRYKLSVDDGQPFPDPASRYQPEGVHGPSQVVQLEGFNWQDHNWQNLPLEDYIIYELHTGTFSEEGNFAGIAAKLPYLKSLGINAIEIMPVAQFPGGRNWGYDGVFPYAVQNTYGGPEGLQQLVQACHDAGIAVILDVVYNHMGPEGNYLGIYGPYFTEKYKTPWGNALNFDDAYCDGVRDYFVENALMWFRDFHIDALRLDAVHAIKDFSAVHLLQQIKQATDVLMAETGRTHFLIVELDLNDTRFINPQEKGGYGMDAQWVDEFHHALRITAGGETTGYYSDFNGIEHLAKAYRDAYVYDGQYSPHRNKKFGIPALDNPGKQFIVFSQNHDQVGNRMLGERTSTLHSVELQKLLAAAVLFSPYLPMLFMGEEWSEPNPFLYFVSHTDAELAEAVRKGRKAEFAAFHAQGEAPDPVDANTFQQSKLQWQLLEKTPHKTMLAYYQGLIQLRKTHPVLRSTVRKGLSVAGDKERNCLVLFRTNGQDALVCLMNFSQQAQSFKLPGEQAQYQKIFDSASPQWGGPKAAPENATTEVQVQPESILVYEAI